MFDPVPFWLWFVVVLAMIAAFVIVVSILWEKIRNAEDGLAFKAFNIDVEIAQRELRSLEKRVDRVIFEYLPRVRDQINSVEDKGTLWVNAEDGNLDRYPVACIVKSVLAHLNLKAVYTPAKPAEVKLLPGKKGK